MVFPSSAFRKLFLKNFIPYSNFFIGSRTFLVSNLLHLRILQCFRPFDRALSEVPRCKLDIAVCVDTLYVVIKGPAEPILININKENLLTFEFVRH